jgi:hypothetical protein
LFDGCTVDRQTEWCGCTEKSYAARITTILAVFRGPEKIWGMG